MVLPRQTSKRKPTVHNGKYVGRILTDHVHKRSSNARFIGGGGWGFVDDHHHHLSNPPPPPPLGALGARFEVLISREVEELLDLLHVLVLLDVHAQIPNQLVRQLQAGRPVAQTGSRTWGVGHNKGRQGIFPHLALQVGFTAYHKMD